MTSRRRVLSQAIALACALGAAPAAWAQNLDLGSLGTRGFRIVGSATTERSGVSVSGAGDVNGDGLADVIIGARQGSGQSGRSYVVFGRAGATDIDLSAPLAGGFRIDGVNANDRNGAAVSGAGDVNGDGLADLVIGAMFADPGGVNDAGESYVVFGKTDDAPVNLATLDAGGFRIRGFTTSARTGLGVSGAGDVNGDGLDDVLIGGYRDSSFTGESYVVFGKTGTATVELATLGAAGFRIEGAAAGDQAGGNMFAHCISGAGDVNGDGRADFVVGAVGVNVNGTLRAGTAYVLFGSAAGGDIDLADLGDRGFRIEGFATDHGVGCGAAGAGDVNGDGLADVIVGGYGVNDLTGAAYVVFGKADTGTVEVNALSDAGFLIAGIGTYDATGSGVAGAGDINGDGLADVVVGAYGADPLGRNYAGQISVVFGKADTDPVQLATLSTGAGFHMAGATANDESGRVVSGAGDFNGDGLADLIIGAYNVDLPGRTNAGASYIVYGAADLPASAVYRVRQGNGDALRGAVGISGDGSNDDTPDARFWIDFDQGSDASAQASSETVTVHRTPGAYTEPVASTHWTFATTRTGWSAAEVRLRYLASDLTIADETQMQVIHAPSDAGPFAVLQSVVNPLDNTISTNINAAGVLYLGPPNRVPAFDASDAPAVQEDAGEQVVATAITSVDDGDPGLSQDVSFPVDDNSNPALFAVAPSFDPSTGVLRYTPAADAFGVAEVAVYARDDGPDLSPNQNQSQIQSIMITVNAVNDAPFFTASDPAPVRNDVVGVVTVPNWATFSAGAANESAQTATEFLVDQVSNAALFAAAPAVASNGNLQFTIETGASGTSTFRVRVRDSGGTANGGVDLSLPQTFTITVLDSADALFTDGFE